MKSSLKIMKILSLLSVIFLAIFLASCGGSGGGGGSSESGQTQYEAEATIGPDGGTIQTDTGHSIDIPAAALEEEVVMSLTSLSETELPLPLPPGVSSMGAFLRPGVGPR